MLEAPAGLRIRGATPADAPAIATVHVRSWRAAYRGQIPDETLDRMSVEGREATWREWLGDPRPEQRTWVAEEGGRVVGFSSTAPTEDADAAPGTAEVYTIYLEPEAFGKGIGRALFAQAVDDLRARGFRTATLWVLETNERARRFYESAGWWPDGAVTTERVDCSNLPTVRYRVDLT